MNDKTYINGPKIPFNVYYYTDPGAFGKYLDIKQFKKDALVGKSHPDVSAVVAALLKDAKVLCIGNQHGNKGELIGIIDSYYGALEFQEKNASNPLRDFDKKVDEMMNIDEWFLSELPPNRQQTYNDRIIKFDFMTYMSKFTFPDMPTGSCPMFEQQTVMSRNNDAQNGGRNGNDDQNISNINDKNDKEIGIFDKEDSPCKFSDNEDEIKAAENDNDVGGDDPTQFTPSQILPARGGLLVEKGFEKRFELVMKLRTLLAKNIGRIVRKEMREKGQIFPINWTWKNCKSEFGVFTTKMVFYLMLYRVFYGLTPGANKFHRFFEKRGDELKVKVGVIYGKCHKLLRKKGVIDSAAARVKRFDEYDIIEKECNVLFKVEGKKLVEHKSLLGKRPLDISESDEFKFVPRPLKRRRTDRYGGSIDTSLGGDGSTPLLHDGLSNSQRNMMKQMAFLISENNNKMINKLGGTTNSSAVDSVQDMILNPARGIAHFSDEFKQYHLTKSKTYGFQLVGKEVSKNGSINGRNKIYENFVNEKPSRKEQIQNVQGKLGLFP